MKSPQMVKRATALLGAASMTLAGCAAHNQAVWEPPKLLKPSPALEKLTALPAPGQKVPVAVYGFTDQTGQFKSSETTQSLSRAVTQGATSILIKALQDSGQRSWFQVIERERLDNVLRERAVIREMRANYLGEKKVNPNALPPLLFAGILLEGGIIGYDSNTKSGGVGARFLGIGAHTQYREDTITLFLRAVSVKTGEVLATVSVRKTIASVSAGADAFRYVAFKDLLEAEAGFAYNEPDELALQHAIEKAVYSLIMEGAVQNLWCFNTTDDYAQGMIRTYLAERDSVKDEKVVMPGGPWSPSCQKNVAHTQAAPLSGPPTQAPVAIASALQPIAAPAQSAPVTLAPRALVLTSAVTKPATQVDTQGEKKPVASALAPAPATAPTLVAVVAKPQPAPLQATAPQPKPVTPLAPEKVSAPVTPVAIPPSSDGARPAAQPAAKDKPIEPESTGTTPLANQGGQ